MNDMADAALAQRLIQEVSTYLKPQDVEHVREAIAYTRVAHGDQKRKSGEPYVTHPIEVARILAPFHLDVQTIVAALLHDVVEDTEITADEIATKFGKPVSELVEGLSKLDKLSFETREDAQAENFRKMLMAMARDVRVVLIKLADRLHNMRTLGAMSSEQCQRIAEETLQIYAQIAYRMGLHDIYQELQDLSFQYLHPQAYQELSEALRIARGKRRKILEEVLVKLRTRLAEQGIEADVTGRKKSLFSIYKKMQEKSLAFSDVLDVFAFRILVNKLSDCYLALGVLHGLYKPMPGKFKDYIAIPKENGYQSLHSTLMVPPEKPAKPHPTFAPDPVSVTETPIEVQIRTHEMHKIADVGVASHWLYKSGDTSISDMHQKTHQWLQDLLELLNHSNDSSEFMEHLRVDLFPDEVYVFTHTGKIRSLPRGATAVDFAYHLHERIGNHCYAVKVNHLDVPLHTELRNGDRVEIFHAPHSRPQQTWLDFVTTSRARTHIRHFYRTMQLEELVRFGKKLLDKACRAIKLPVHSITDEHWNALLKATKVKTREDMLADIGLGNRHCALVARQLAQMADTPVSEAGEQMPIIVQGTEGMAVKFAKCCNPIPGDPIVGELILGKGLEVHTADCPTLQRGFASHEPWINVAWDGHIERLFSVNFRILAHDEPGVLGKVSAAIGNAGFNIENLSIGREDKYAVLHFTLAVNHRRQLSSITTLVEKLPEVVRVIREKNCEVLTAPKGQ